MHVLIIPTGIYPMPRFPLNSVFEQHQVEALRGAGVQVGVLSGGVITTRYLGRRIPYLEHDLVNGVPVYRAHRRVYLPARLGSRLTRAERTYGGLKPLLEEYVRAHGRPDIVHAHNLTAGGLVACLIADDFGVPYVVTEHTSTYASDIGAVRRDLSILTRAAAHASTIIAVGSQLADNLRGSLGGELSERVVVVPNVVDPAFLAKPLAKSTSRPYTVAGIGSLIPRKNYELLLRAFAGAALPADARLVIGGDGPRLGRLRALAEDIGLSERVDFLGRLSRQDVVRLLQQSHLFAHPSDSESFGVVLIEAMAFGVPVLATASGGPQDIVTPDVGLLTAVGDVDEFADSLSELFRRRWDFDARQVRESCRIRFGAETFAARMAEIYRRAMA